MDIQKKCAPELRRLQLGLCLSIRISQILRFDKNEPWETRSNTKQDAFNKEANRRAEVFLAETFCPQGNGGLSNELSMLVNRDQRSEETSEITGFWQLLHVWSDAASLPWPVKNKRSFITDKRRSVNRPFCVRTDENRKVELKELESYRDLLETYIRKIAESSVNSRSFLKERNQWN